MRSSARLAVAVSTALSLWPAVLRAQPADEGPPPDQASGILIPRDTSEYAALWVPRALLFVPRWALEVPFAVPRVALFAYERYDLRDRFVEIFFNDDETIGLFPTAFIETGYGLNVGVRFIYRDLFGERGRLRARAGYGGRFEQEGSASVTTGHLLGGRFELGLRGDYEVHPRSRFFGIGNIDGVASRYRHDDVDVELAGHAHVTRRLRLRVAGAYHWTKFDPDADVKDDVSIEDAYDTAELTGYDTDLSNLRGELSIIYDSRRVTRSYLAPPAPSTGWRLVAFGGPQIGLGDDPSRFARLGADIQRYFDLWLGDRVLIARVYVEAVAGRMDEIPFVDLPSLGGEYLLRGYSRDRFRDRYLAAATLEYDYPIHRRITGFLFADAGRVWHRLDDLDPSDPRLGFGGGIQIHSRDSFIGRLFVGSSIDGGLQLNLSLDPVFGANTRMERHR